MNQGEITTKLTFIIWRYCLENSIISHKLNEPITRILERRGITPDVPMYATARLMVARDVLRVWEGD